MKAASRTNMITPSTAAIALTRRVRRCCANSDNLRVQDVSVDAFVASRSSSATQCYATYTVSVIAQFHYTGPTGPDQTKSADFVGDQGLAKKSVRVRSGPVGPV